MELNYLKLAQRLAEWAKHNCKPRLRGFCLSAAKQIQADPLNKPSAKQTHWPGIYHGNMLRAKQAHGKPPPCPQDASGGAQAARLPLWQPRRRQQRPWGPSWHGKKSRQIPRPL